MTKQTINQKEKFIYKNKLCWSELIFEYFANLTILPLVAIYILIIFWIPYFNMSLSDKLFKNLNKYVSKKPLMGYFSRKVKYKIVERRYIIKEVLERVK